MRLLLAVAALLASTSAQDATTRLPGESLPTTIDVTITPYLDEQERSFQFDGSSTINVDILTDTTTLTLHYGQTVTALSVTGDDGDIASSFEQLDDGTSFLVITLGQQVNAGDSLTLAIDFTGDILEDTQGFYRSSYDQDGETRWLAVTQFERAAARLAVPCYDEPAIKPLWTFTFRPLQGLGVRFNTPAASTTDDADGRQTIVFEQTPPLAAFLLVWLISDFQGVVSPTETNTTVWTNRDTLDQVEYAAVSAPRTVDVMEQLVSVPYNYGSISKMDHAPIPDFTSGARGSWGFLTYSQPYVLMIENYTSEATKEMILSVIQFEVSQQWFGNLVTPSWWSLLWLNKGFATFFENYATAELEPTWRLDETFVVTRMLRLGMALDSYTTSSAVVAEGTGQIAYFKGAGLVRMLQSIVTSDLFYEGLNGYLLANQLSDATEAAMLAAMDAVAPAGAVPDGETVTSVMQPWLLQAGYPVLSVVRDYDANTVTITQTRFLLDGTPDDRTWSVPLTYTWASEADFTTTTPRAWLTDAQQTFDIAADAADWLILNVQVVGFYRINYDAANWALLATQLQTNPEALPPVNRVQLLKDALHLLDAGQLDVDTVFTLTSYLANEVDYVAWSGGRTVVNSLADYAADADAYTDWALSLLETITTQLGYTEQPDDSHTTRILRSTVATMACDLGQAACTEQAYQQFLAYEAAPDDTTTWVGPDMKSVVYCEGARQGGAEAVAFLQERLAATNVISEQDELTNAISCAETRYLRSLLEKTAAGRKGGLKPHYLHRLLKAVLSNRRNAVVALDFIVAHAEQLVSRLSKKQLLDDELSELALNMRDKHMLEKVRLAAEAVRSHTVSSRIAARAAVVDRVANARLVADKWLRHRSAANAS